MQLSMSKIFDCLYPTYCIVCQVLVSFDHVLCSQCSAYVQPPQPRQYSLGSGKSVVVHAVGAYQPPLDGMVRAKKYGLRSCSVQLGVLLSQQIARLPYEYDVLIPVPLHWARYAWRGYNQAVVMARVVSRICKIPLVQPFCRMRNTQTQQRLNKEQRIANVSGAFALKSCWQRQRASRMLAGKRVLLIDDVCTTGATISALATAVWHLGPNSVHAAVACSGKD